MKREEKIDDDPVCEHAKHENCEDPTRDRLMLPSLFISKWYDLGVFVESPKEVLSAPHLNVILC